MRRTGNHMLMYIVIYLKDTKGWENTWFCFIDWNRTPLILHIKYQILLSTAAYVTKTVWSILWNLINQPNWQRIKKVIPVVITRVTTTSPTKLSTVKLHYGYCRHEQKSSSVLLHLFWSFLCVIIKREYCNINMNITAANKEGENQSSLYLAG